MALVGLVALLAGGAYAQQVAATRRSSAAMTDAAQKFVASLTEQQRPKALHAFDDIGRSDWEFFPRERKGLPLKDMTLEQRRLAHQLLQAGLSNYGYAKATAIMQMEIVLGEIEAALPNRPPFQRDEELYFFAVFGTPTGSQPWGWRVEGHHVSVHFTLANGQLISNTPLGMGSSPAEVRQGPRAGFRILGNEEDKGRQLMMSLTSAQQEAATLLKDRTPGDLLIMSKMKVEPLQPAGVSHRQMTAGQREVLTRLLDEYLDRMPEDVAAARKARIAREGLDAIHFSWAGTTEPGAAHYYRLQGRSFVLEYDNSQNQGNHIHTAWRDFDDDFGRDWLQEHYRERAHEP